MTELTRRTATRRDLPDPYNDRQLIGYLRSVAAWHGYIRFLGLPDLQENPDTPIADLFVESLAHPRHVRPDEPPDTWLKDRVRVIDLLEKHRRVLLLGDPGSGKSTLLNWVAWNFTRWDGGEWLDRFGPLVPIPLVIRELGIGSGISWDRLLDYFLRHGVARDTIDRPALDRLVRSGQAVILVDGLDELGDQDTRRELRDVLIEAMNDSARECAWLLTSRIVGYDEVPYDPPDSPAVKAGRVTTISAAAFGVPLARAVYQPIDIVRRYVCPFDDTQVDRFANLWYAGRERRGVEQAGFVARQFLRALREADAPRALARIPNLLTLFALVYRVYAEIPHGRSVLYGKVAEAYLESIDKSRGMKPKFQRERMERWLAFLGFHLQRQRSERKGRDRESREILISRDELVRLLAVEMKAVGRQPTPTEAEEFLAFAARRSGLLLPRGEGQFSFMHLSFQEFFAARFLAWQLMSPKWSKGETYPGTHADDLNRYADSSVWTESLVLLFELLKEHPDWTELLRECLFGVRYTLPAAQPGEEHLERANLLAEILINPHTGLTDEERDRDLRDFMRWEIARQNSPERRKLKVQTPFSRLFGQTGYHPVRRPVVLVEILKKSAYIRLSVRGCTGLTDLSLLSGLFGLQELDLTGTGVADVTPLSDLSGLRSLDLMNTGVADVTPLSGLTGLQSLDLSDTGVTDLTPLSGLYGLRSLDLTSTGVTDLTPLSAMPGLQELNLMNTGVADVTPLSGLSGLRYLDLMNTGVADVTPLSELTGLRTLYLSGTGVTDVTPLSGLSGLQSLGLMNTGVTDVTPLSELTGLQTLYLSGTGVVDVAPLSGLTGLRELDLMNTGVADVAPLFGLTGLQTLYLTNTKVTDVTPLSGLSGLRTLYLSGTGVTDVTPLSGLSQLRIIR